MSPMSEFEAREQQLVAELDALAARVAQLEAEKAELEMEKVNRTADDTGHLFRCAKVNGTWNCGKGCAVAEVARLRAALEQLVEKWRKRALSLTNTTDSSDGIATGLRAAADEVDAATRGGTP